MSPELHSGDFVFVKVQGLAGIEPSEIIGFFREKEGITLILPKGSADLRGLSYGLVCSWITLNVVSDLQDVGLTAAFSNALAEEHISCNVIAGFNHDHIFIPKQDAEKALRTLIELPQK